MNFLFRILYRNQILEFTEGKLNRWSEKEAIDKLIFAANYGIYNIRLKCIELLESRKSTPEVNNLLKYMIKDKVEIVSEAAIKLLESNASPKLAEQIANIRNERKEEKKLLKNNKRTRASDYKTPGRTSPSEKLMSRLRDQQKSNEPPYGF